MILGTVPMATVYLSFFFWRSKQYTHSSS